MCVCVCVCVRELQPGKRVHLLLLIELPWVVQEEAGIPEDMGQDVVPEAPVNGGPGVNPNFMTCRGEPLRVAQDYTDLCDMGIYDPATNFLPPPTDRDTVSVIIPINTPMHKIALEVSTPSPCSDVL